jgi:hypothetical protein
VNVEPAKAEDESIGIGHGRWIIEISREPRPEEQLVAAGKLLAESFEVSPPNPVVPRNPVRDQTATAVEKRCVVRIHVERMRAILILHQAAAVVSPQRRYNPATDQPRGCRTLRPALLDPIESHDRIILHEQTRVADEVCDRPMARRSIGEKKTREQVRRDTRERIVARIRLHRIAVLAGHRVLGHPGAGSETSEILSFRQTGEECCACVLHQNGSVVVDIRGEREGTAGV